MRYEARVPLQLNLAGAWTDLPSFAATTGGGAINVAVSPYASGSISRPTAGGLLSALRGDRSYLAYSVDVPGGSGLGQLASERVLWVTLMRTPFANTLERPDIAQTASQIGAALGILDGTGDEFTPALGGICHITIAGDVSASRLTLDATFVAGLMSRFVLVYVAETLVNPLLGRVLEERLHAGDTSIRSALEEANRGVSFLKSALLSSDPSGVVAAINTAFAAQQALGPGVQSPRVAEVIAWARSRGAIAGTVAGRGAEGCALLLAEPDRLADLRSALRARRLRVLESGLDTYGVFLRKG